MIDFQLGPELLALRERVLAFINEKIVPLENDPRNDFYEVQDSLRE